MHYFIHPMNPPIDNQVYYQWMHSPLGALLLTSNGQALTGLYLQGQQYFPQHFLPYLPQQSSAKRESTQIDLLIHTQQQLTEYFAHQRQHFDLPLAPQGTDFQRQVWQQLLDIPFGHTVSYGILAQRIGQPKASRAVGAANGRNPISIIVPCHRVIAASGKLTGYAGGLECKQWLLQHEQVPQPLSHQSPTSGGL